MTHEFRKIVETAHRYYLNGIPCVMASVVALDGSSYRKPGVRMLIAKDGTMTGAVSGGCVEKEIVFQAESVFKFQKAKMMTYDGRFRLGCEGILYILIEPLQITTDLYNKINQQLKARLSIQIISKYHKSLEEDRIGLRTYINLGYGDTIPLSNSDSPLNKGDNNLLEFTQELSPLFQLYVFGAEHDAVQLSLICSFMGWDVIIIAPPNDPRELQDFPGASQLLHLNPEDITGLAIDQNSATVLMNHNYAKDFNFLIHLLQYSPCYIGILGSRKRRIKLLNELISLKPEVSYEWVERIYGPAGLDIAAVTPQEIANAIISEILVITRAHKKAAQSLSLI